MDQNQLGLVLRIEQQVQVFPDVKAFSSGILYDLIIYSLKVGRVQKKNCTQFSKIPIKSNFSSQISTNLGIGSFQQLTHRKLYNYAYSQKRPGKN